MSKERTAEDWGRVAVSLPGWRWMPGMLVPHRGYGRLDDDDVSDHPLYRLPMRDDANAWPDPDDPATEGCLTRLLGPARAARQALHAKGCHDDAHRLHIAFMLGKDIGRACIAAAEALGRWPGGES